MFSNTPGSTQVTRSDRIIWHLLDALATIQREAHEKASEGSLDYIFGVATQALKNVSPCMTPNVDGYNVVTHDSRIDAAVNAGIEEAWRIHSCSIDLSNDAVMESVQKIIVDAVKKGI